MPMLLPIFLALQVAAAPVAAPDDVTEVRVQYHWGGLGAPTDETFAVRHVDDHWELEGESKEGTFLGIGSPSTRSFHERLNDGQAIRKLLVELQAAPVPFESTVDSLASPAWLAANAPIQYAQHFDKNERHCSPEAEALFIRTFQSPEGARAAFKKYFSGFWTDDYPSARVTVRTSDGKERVASSKSQKYRMLPWSIQDEANWSLSLPMALANVLPAGSELKARLESSEEGLAREFGALVSMPIDDEWASLEARCQFPGLVAEMERQFRVVKLWARKKQYFGATLDQQTLPPNLTVQVVFSLESARETEKQLQAFHSKMGAYLALAVPFAKAHPKQTLELSFYHGESLTSDDIDLNATRAEAKRLKKVAGEAVVLDDRSPRVSGKWVLLPTGEVLHWEH